MGSLLAVSWQTCQPAGTRALVIGRPLLTPVNKGFHTISARATQIIDDAKKGSIFHFLPYIFYFAVFLTVRWMVQLPSFVGNVSILLKRKQIVFRIC